MLSGKLSEEIEVKVTAAEAWNVYGTLQLGRILVEKLPHIIQKIEILEGDGGVGTVIKKIIIFPDMPCPTNRIEKYTVVDNEKRLKIIELIEGGPLELGFTKFWILFQVLEKDENSCITRVTVEYEIGEDGFDKIPFASAKPFVALMNAVADVLTKPKEA